MGRTSIGYMSTNPKKPENTETLGKITKSLGDSKKSLGEVSETVVKTVGKISELVPKSPEKIKTSPAEAPKSVETSPAEAPKSAETSPAEKPKVSKPKRKQSPSQLANLRKGRVKITDSSVKPVKEVTESVPESPKMAFTFPVKALIIMAFIAGGTLGFFGLWNWWKNQKKSKESPDDIIEVYNNSLPPSQEELNQIAAMENLEN